MGEIQTLELHEKLDKLTEAIEALAAKIERVLVQLSSG